MAKKKGHPQSAEQEPAAEAPAEAPAADKKPKKAKKAAKPQAAAAQPAAEAAPAAKASKRRAKDEIDAIFAAGKKQEAAEEGNAAEELDPELKEVAEKVKAARAKAAGKRPKVEGSKDDIFGESAGKARKRTEEGYAIYNEEELGMGKKGGDTPLCPFDCDCCY